jgi:hypothetical protein
MPLTDGRPFDGPAVSSSRQQLCGLACVVIAAAVVGTGGPPIRRQCELDDLSRPRDRRGDGCPRGLKSSTQGCAAALTGANDLAASTVRARHDVLLSEAEREPPAAGGSLAHVYRSGSEQARAPVAFAGTRAFCGPDFGPVLRTTSTADWPAPQRPAARFPESSKGAVRVSSNAASSRSSFRGKAGPSRRPITGPPGRRLEMRRFGEKRVRRQRGSRPPFVLPRRWPWKAPRRRPLNRPVGGHRFSPWVATVSPHVLS